MTAPTVPTLTADQRRLLAMVAAGLTNHQIGNRLGIATSNVANRLTVIYRALDARNAPHAVAIAMSHGLIYASPNRRTTQ